MTELNLQENLERECGSCTECCQGYFSGEAYGHKFYAGVPCHFVGENGCSIYANRPEPCKFFKCEWLINNHIPEWMKPNKCKVVIVSHNWSYEGQSQGEYLCVSESGQQIDSKVLAWLFDLHLNKSIPMIIQVSKGLRYYGNEKFLKFAKTLNISEQ